MQLDAQQICICGVWTAHSMIMSLLVHDFILPTSPGLPLMLGVIKFTSHGTQNLPHLDHEKYSVATPWLGLVAYSSPHKKFLKMSSIKGAPRPPATLVWWVVTMGRGFPGMRFVRRNKRLAPKPTAWDSPISLCQPISQKMDDSLSS